MKDRLDSLGTALSGGQQQRLTIARALSHRPEILCLDEFSIAIDPVTTMRIEDVLKELREEITIVLVTNLTQQARRLSDRTMFLLEGEIVELDDSRASSSPATRRARRRATTSTGSSDERRSPNAIETRGPLPLVRELPGALRRLDRHQERDHHLPHRPERLREDDAPSLLQPRERALRKRPHRGRDPDPRGEHLRPRRLAHRAAQGRGDGLPAPEPAPHLGLRERRLRPAHPRAARPS